MSHTDIYGRGGSPVPHVTTTGCTDTQDVTAPDQRVKFQWEAGSCSLGASMSRVPEIACEHSYDYGSTSTSTTATHDQAATTTRGSKVAEDVSSFPAGFGTVDLSSNLEGISVKGFSAHDVLQRPDRTQLPRRFSFHSGPLSSTPSSVGRRSCPARSLTAPLQTRRSSDLSSSSQQWASVCDGSDQISRSGKDAVGEEYDFPKTGASGVAAVKRGRGRKRRRALTDCSDDSDGELDGLPFLFLSQYRRQCINHALS